MEIEQFNLIENLSEEILLHIFSFLGRVLTRFWFNKSDAPTIILASLVCKEWYQLTTDDHLWKNLTAEKKHDVGYSTHIIAEDGNARKLFMALNKLELKALRYPLIQCYVDASSIDHTEQGPDKPIIPLEQRTADLFWSSKGSSNIDSNEYLVYKLVQPLCILHTLQILPYKANFQKGQPIYAPQAVQLSVGFNKNDMYWSSPIYPIRNINEIQNIRIVPEIVIGTYIRIDLFGRNTTQPADDLYYTCLEYVNLYGSPIGSLTSDIIGSSLCNYALKNPSFLKEMGVEASNTNSTQLFKYFQDKLPQNAKQYLQRKVKIDAIYRYLNVESNCIEPIKMILMYREELHCKEVFDLFLVHGNKYLKPYFNALLSDPELVFSKQESLELIKLVLSENISKMLIVVGLWLEQGKLTISEELGDFIAQFDKRLASTIYLSVPIPDKFIDTLIQLKMYSKVLKYVAVYRYPVDFIGILKNLKQVSILEALEFAVCLSEDPRGITIDLAEICESLGLNIPRDTWDYRKLLAQELQKVKNTPP